MLTNNTSKKNIQSNLTHLQYCKLKQFNTPLLILDHKERTKPFQCDEEMAQTNHCTNNNQVPNSGKIIAKYTFN